MASQPSPPDPFKQAQAQQNAEMGAAWTSAILNNPNQVNPYGTQSYSISGYEKVRDAKGKMIDVPRYTQTTTLSPAQQGLLNLQNKTSKNLGQLGVSQSAKLQGLLGKNVNTKGVAKWAVDKQPTDRRAIEAAMLSRFNEDQAKQSSAQDAQLAARGLSPGSGQYSSVQHDRDRARTDAVNQAYLASGQESRAAMDAVNNVRQAQMTERLGLRNQPLNEISALLSGSQVTTPQFQSFSRQGINAAPIGSYIAQNYQTRSNAANQFNQGLFGLAGAGMQAYAMSDRRLKEDILPTGETLAGVPVYTFYFKAGGPLQVGVMADEVREVYPDLVATDPETGFDMVDYAGLRARAMEAA